MADVLGVLLGAAVVIWLTLSVASRLRKQKIKETVSDIKDWIVKQFKT